MKHATCTGCTLVSTGGGPLNHAAQRVGTVVCHGKAPCPLPSTSHSSSLPGYLTRGAAIGAAVGYIAVCSSHRRNQVSSFRGTLRQRATAVQVADTDLSSSVPEDKLAYTKQLFEDVLEVRVPKKLETCLAVFQGSGYTLLGKDEWKLIGGELHPFLLPLGTQDTPDGNIDVVGLLVRSPNGSRLNPDEFPVVSQKPRTNNQVKLIATDIDKYIMKRAEEAHFRKEKKDQPVIEATKEMYNVRFSGNDQTALDWLLLEVGSFPDVYKHLAQEHIEGGDAKTGLVIADTMRDQFGSSWGFPHSYVCRVLRDHFNGKADVEDRNLEADHSAVRCFTSGYPLWTLEEEGDTLEDLLLEAKMPKLGSLDSLRVFYLNRAVDDQRAAVRTGSISLGCATMAKAQALMDAVCCGHKNYSRIREELRDMYDEVPGCESLVNLIEYFAE